MYMSLEDRDDGVYYTQEDEIPIVYANIVKQEAEEEETEEEVRRFL